MRKEGERREKEEERRKEGGKEKERRKKGGRKEEERRRKGGGKGRRKGEEERGEGKEKNNQHIPREKRSQEHTDIANINRNMKCVQCMINNTRSEHQSRIDSSSHDTPKGVP